MKKGSFFILSSFRIRYDTQSQWNSYPAWAFQHRELRNATSKEKKRSRRSFQYPMSEGTVDYIGSKRIGPTFEAFP